MNVIVENEWHGFDRVWHDRIHPKHDQQCCLMCEIERMTAEQDRLVASAEPIVFALTKEDVNFAAFKIGELGAFRRWQAWLLRMLGMRTVQDLDNFSTKVNAIIEEIMKAEGTFLTSVVDEKKWRSTFQILDIKKLYKPQQGAGEP